MKGIQGGNGTNLLQFSQHRSKINLDVGAKLEGGSFNPKSNPEKCHSQFLKSRILDSAIRKESLPKININLLERGEAQVQIQSSQSGVLSNEVSESTGKTTSPQPADSCQIRTVFHKNSAVSHCFHDQIDLLDNSIQKVLFGLQTIEAAKAEGTEDGILRAQMLLASLGWKKKSSKRGRKPHCPLLKEICGGIKQQIEQREIKKEMKKKLHHEAKLLKAQQAETKNLKKSNVSNEGMSLLHSELLNNRTRTDLNPAAVSRPRLGTSWGHLSIKMDEENNSSVAQPESQNHLLAAPTNNNNNEDLASIFGGHGSILSFRYLQRRKGSSSSYFQSVIGALREKTEIAQRNAEDSSAKKSYLGGDGLLSNLLNSKTRLLEDQASIGPELSHYLAFSGSRRMFGDPNYDVDY